MKRMLFAALAALMLLPITASAQGGPLVDVVRFQGYVTTTVRDAIDVPVGQVYLVWNVTTAQFEYADDNDVWSALVSGVDWSDPVDANIVPDAASTRNIGSAANPFLNGYFDDVDLTDRLTIAGELILDGAAAYMTLTPTTTAGPVAEGNVYADDTANRLKFHDGTSYKNVLIEGDATDDQTALQVPITDAGAYWASGNVEALSQEIGAQFATVDGEITAVEGDVLEDNNITLPTSTVRYIDIPASSDFVFRLGGLTDVFTVDGAGTISFDTYAPTVPDLPYNEASWNGSLQVPTLNAVRDIVELKVSSDTSGEPTGADQITNIVSLTRAELAAGTPISGTSYVIEDPIIEEVIAIAASDLSTALTTGTNKASFRMPWAATLTDVKVSLNDPGTSTGITVDINENGTTVLSTKLTTDATEETSATATTAAVISDSAIGNDSKLTIDFDAVPTDASGAVVYLYFERPAN